MPDEVKVAVCIPTAGTVRMGFAYSLAGMVAHFAANKVPTVPEAKITLSMRVMESSNWITNRERLAKQCVELGDTHLMFLDDDMTFAPQVLQILLGRRQDVVTTNYLIKTLPAKDFVAVSPDGKRVPTKADSEGMEPLMYSGFGVSLIKVDVFKAIPQPWFLPKFNPETGDYTTEDNPFFEKVREAGFTVYVDHDASKLVAHVGSKSWSWDEVVYGEKKANIREVLSSISEVNSHG